MSASREKKKRLQAQATATPTPETKKGMGKTAKTVLGVVIAVVAIAVIVFFAMVSTGFFQANLTAATAGDRNLSAVEVNYWFADTYNQELSEMAYLVDEELPLSEQEFPEEGFDTWYDYMLDLSLSNAAFAYAIYDEAMANGFTISETTQSSIDSQMNMLDMYGSLYGYSNGNGYLSAMYGPGSKKASYEDYLTVNFVAQEYAASMQSDATYDQAALDAYYAEHADEIDKVSFRIFDLPAAKEANEEGTEVVTEATMDAAEELAIAMAEESKGNEDAFLALALENTSEELKADYDADAVTLESNVTVSAAPEAYREWLGDDSRTFGDVYCTENASGDGYHVLFFLEQTDMDIALPSVRHILISAEDSEDADSMAAAKAEADALLEEYLAGEQTEEAFAALADANSADPGSTGNGGLYENIYPNQMVTAFNDWCFAEHEVGDTGVVETEYGYHVMYFCGTGDTYKNVMTDTAKRNSEYTAWEEGVEAGLTWNVVSDKYVSNF